MCTKHFAILKSCAFFYLQCAAYEGRIKDLENQLRREQEEHSAALSMRDSEIRRLREALEDQITEFKDLMDIKIALDAEIAAYRKLLEAEETRYSVLFVQSKFYIWPVVS